MEISKEKLREVALTNMWTQMAVEDIGIYPQSISGGPNPYKKRTERMEGHNSCLMRIAHKAVALEEWIDKHPLKTEIEDALLIERVFATARSKSKIRKDEEEGEVEVSLFVLCNDLFYWAMADLEDIKPEELKDLEKCYTESPKYGSELWCCRKRGMRPQIPYYEYFNEAEKVLFDACGPERTKEECG